MIEESMHPVMDHVKFLIFSIDDLNMFMGIFSRMLGVGRVLFAGLRDGDMTEWYQSSWLQQWASMGQEDAVTKGGISFSVQQSSGKFQEFF